MQIVDSFFSEQSLCVKSRSTVHSSFWPSERKCLEWPRESTRTDLNLTKWQAYQGSRGRGNVRRCQPDRRPLHRRRNSCTARTHPGRRTCACRSYPRVYGTEPRSFCTRHARGSSYFFRRWSFEGSVHGCIKAINQCVSWHRRKNVEQYVTLHSKMSRVCLFSPSKPPSWS